MFEGLGLLARMGLSAQSVSEFKRRKEACTKEGGKLGMYGFMSPPNCYDSNGDEIKLGLGRVGGFRRPKKNTKSKKQTRSNKKTRTKKRHLIKSVKKR